MQKQKIICLVLPILLLISGIASAGINYINIYQKKEIYGKRQNDPSSANDLCKLPGCPEMIPDPAPISAICAEVGYIAKSDLGTKLICTNWYYGAVTCCENWTCNNSYPYHSGNCSKTLKGESCTGSKNGVIYYKSCS